jgi:competence ComEA-like helix-hairpin-helix protein
MRKMHIPLLLWLLCAGLWLAVAVDKNGGDEGSIFPAIKESNGETTDATFEQRIPVKMELAGHAPSRAADCININSASVNELDALPGIGPVIAGRIVDFRKTNGPFAGLNDVDRVKGIGPALLQKLGDRICF